MTRSAELLIGALGILKAGGAYVALDPGYPTQRLAMLLDDAQTPVVVTHPGAAETLPAGPWQTVILDTKPVERSPYSSGPPDSDWAPENLAYVIFTSGSTGRPKGVQITHANLLNLVHWHRRAFHVTSADRATLQASPGFDAAVWESWPYLSAGATLYLVHDAIRASPERLRDWLVARGITISFLPTVLAQSMLDLRWPPKTALRILLTGADTLRRYPPAGLPFALVNNYGPTECTVVATSGTVPSDGPEPLPSIGRPIDNTYVYIVDEQLHPVAPGAPGELLIGGAGVGRGYLNRADLTAARFVRDPISTDPRARVYRTGDLGRLLPTGEIAFLGRTDDQIKIRGYRIEPQEISAALDSHPAVATSCVVARGDASGDARLVAYIVPALGARPTADLLQAFLRESLPNYMVPSVFVPLTGLPLSANGKLDRSALPEPTEENMLGTRRFEAPQSPLEEKVAGILSTLLGVSRISRNDNFFEMGGHSLLGTQTIARIGETFGIELSLHTLFEEPTVKGIAGEIARRLLASVEAMTEDEARRTLAAPQEQAVG